MALGRPSQTTCEVSVVPKLGLALLSSNLVAGLPR